MGRIAQCVGRHGDRVSTGKAELETDDIRFRGDFTVRVRRADLQSVAVAGDLLRLRTADGDLELALGAKAAQAWADAISHPPTLLDKLGIGARTRLALVGDLPAEFLAELQAAGVAVEALGPGLDVALLAATAQAELTALDALRQAVFPNGAVWVVWPKGRKELTEGHVRQAALDRGLVDVKVARFSAALSALKLVVPKSARG